MKSYYRYTNPKRHLFIEQYAYYVTAYKYNWHKDIELLMVLNGEIDVNTDGESHILSSGDLILINSNSGHATMARKPDSIAMVIHFDPIYLSNWIKNYQSLEFVCFSNKANRDSVVVKEMVVAMLMMSTLTDESTEINDLIYESFFQNLLGNLFMGFSPSNKTSNENALRDKHEYVMKIVDYLNKHYRERITLDELVKFTGYNKSYISQLMKQSLGINYYEYLTRVRMREAIFALTTTSEKVSDIAYEHGFSDIKAFNIAFKERFGKTPTEYRQKLLYRPKMSSNSTVAYVENTLMQMLVEQTLRQLNGRFENGSQNSNATLVNDSIDSALGDIQSELKKITEKVKKLKSTL